MNNSYNNNVFDFNHLNRMQLEENFGKYKLSCKVGYFCDFNVTQVSNQPHFHNCYELSIVTSGEGTFFHGGETFPVKQWDVIIADPEVTHEFRVNKLQDLQLIYFQFEIEADSLAKPKNPADLTINSFIREHKVLAKSQKHMLAYLLFFDTYFSVRKSRGFGIQQALKNLILESLETLSMNGGTLLAPQTNVSSTFEMALDYIDHNLNNKILVSEIARELNVSERTLQLLFKKHLNSTIVDYINNKKMNLAAHYLMKQYSVNETASQLGFSNSAQFSRLFKKYLGVNPKQYQQMHIAKIRDFGRRQLNVE
ncbi:helix-turn-helix domain-containing protein [Dethiobacter alkaliphilus]|uniref:helix-turn-helix domain-containing protein n=1 Tax=Dethiobacter alkaliphilus TaxID=427926 RepID=UPI0022269DC6|nr:helix-turn-helix domain-containing protein [Dethiobacter alkaliphilus]MCW3489981.1 helix-turn-helix domain-containing protein [Dethiobacter alkaliphilus]